MTQFWAPDLDNPVNKRFVADYRKKTGRYPTFYAAQSYDTIMLINNAVESVMHWPECILSFPKSPAEMYPRFSSNIGFSMEASAKSFA